MSTRRAIASFSAKCVCTIARYRCRTQLHTCGASVSIAVSIVVIVFAAVVGPALCQSISSGVAAEPLFTLVGHLSQVDAVAVSPDGQLVATADSFYVFKGSLRIWSAATGAQLHAVAYANRAPGGLQQLQFTADGAIIVVAWEYGMSAFSASNGTLLSSVNIRPALSSVNIRPAPTSRNSMRVGLSPDARTALVVSSNVTLEATTYEASLRGLDGAEILRIPNVCCNSRGGLTRTAQALYDASFLALSADGTIVSGYARDRKLSIWSTNGTELKVFDITAAGGNVFRLSPDGSYVVVSSADFSFSPLAPEVYYPIVSTAQPTTISLVSTSNGAVLRSLSAAVSYWTAVSISADSSRILTGGRDGRICIWTAGDGALVQEFSSSGSIAVKAVSFDRLGSHIAYSAVRNMSATATFYSSASVFSTASPSSRSAGHIQLGNFSTFVGPMASTSFDSIRAITNANFLFTAVTIDASESRFHSSNDRKQTHVMKWSASGSQVLRFETSGKDFRSAFAVSPDGTLVAIPAVGGAVRILSAADGTQLKVLVSSSSSTAVAIEFTPDSASVVIAWSRLDPVQVWDVTSGTPVRNLTAPGIDPRDDLFAATSLAISADGRFIAAAGYGGGRVYETADAGRGGVRLWSLASGELLWSFRNTTDGLSYRSVAISPDNAHIAVGEDSTGTVRLLSVASGSQLHAVNQPSESPAGSIFSITGVDFSSSGKVLISGDSQGNVRFWSVGTGKLLRSLLFPSDREFSGNMYAIERSSDGKFVYFTWSPDASAATHAPLMRINLSNLEHELGLSNSTTATVPSSSGSRARIPKLKIGRGTNVTLTFDENGYARLSVPAARASQHGGEVSIFGEGFPYPEPIEVYVVSGGQSVRAPEARFASETEMRFRVPKPLARRTRGLLGTVVSDLRVVSANNAFGTFTLGNAFEWDGMPFSGPMPLLQSASTSGGSTGKATGVFSHLALFLVATCLTLVMHTHV